jgi:hypothetical protein
MKDQRISSKPTRKLNQGRGRIDSSKSTQQESGVSGFFLVNFGLPSLPGSRSDLFGRTKEQGKRGRDINPEELSVP